MTDPTQLLADIETICRQHATPGSEPGKHELALKILKRIEADQPTFKPGDRVRFTQESEYWAGQYATVANHYRPSGPGENVPVNVDGCDVQLYPMRSRIEKVEEP